MSDGKPGRVKKRRQLGVYRFDGVDMRSRNGLRLKAILRGLIVEFGVDNPSSLRELALHRLSLEDAQADAVNGKRIAREDSVRLSNVIMRLEVALRISRAKAAARPTIKDHIRAREAARRSGEAA